MLEQLSDTEVVYSWGSIVMRLTVLNLPHFRALLVDPSVRLLSEAQLTDVMKPPCGFVTFP